VVKIKTKEKIKKTKDKKMCRPGKSLQFFKTVTLYCHSERLKGVKNLTPMNEKVCLFFPIKCDSLKKLHLFPAKHTPLLNPM